MEITKLQLYSYRNYLVSEVIFNHGINVICGKNAQGKTNLLEAVYFCVVGKSFGPKPIANSAIPNPNILPAI